MEAGRSHDIAIGGDGEAAGLDKEPGLLGFSQGLFEEGDGGMVGRMALSKQSHGRPPFVIGEDRVGDSLEEDVDVEGCYVGFPEHAGVMKSGAASVTLHVDSGADARVLQQACDSIVSYCKGLPHMHYKRGPAEVVHPIRIRATIQQGSDNVGRVNNMERGIPV